MLIIFRSCADEGKNIFVARILLVKYIKVKKDDINGDIKLYHERFYQGDEKRRLKNLETVTRKFYIVIKNKGIFELTYNLGSENHYLEDYIK